MCDIQGCDEQPVYFDQQDNKMCRGCVDHEISEACGSIEDYELISEVDAAIASPADDNTETVVCASDLIIFEENLTPARLAEIYEESKTWPIVLSTKTEYDEGYERHQRFKRTSVSLRKKADEFRKQARADLKTGLEKIDTDLQVYLDVIEPIIKKLGASRQRWDEEEEAYKMNIAHDEAERQRAEFERQEMIRTHVQALDENALFDHRKKLEEKEKRLEKNRIEAREKQRLESIEIGTARDKLEREKYEFECEKSRLDFDECWNYYYPENHPLKTDLIAAESSILPEHKESNERIVTVAIDDKIASGKSAQECLDKIDDLSPDIPINIPDNRDSLVCDEIEELTIDHIKYLESHHTAGLENRHLQIELGNLIKRVKLNLQVFTDAVNERKEERA